MKPSALKFAATLLLTLTSAGVLSAPRTADACSPPMSGIFIDHGVEFEQFVPVKGSWAVRVRTLSASLEELSVEVRDESDALVDGTVAHIVAREDDFGGPGESGEFLVIWTPTEELQPGHLYSVSLRATDPYAPEILTVDEDTTFVTIAYPTDMDDPANAEVAAVVGEASLTITENKGLYECCPDPHAGMGSCTSEICWPTEYIYQPTVDIELELPTDENSQQTFHRLETSADTGRFYWTSEAPISESLLFPADHSGPYCVTLQTFALATQELLNEEENCFEHSDLPSYTERELEGVTRPESCEDAPDGGEMPDAGERPDSGTPPGDVGLDADGGCTTTPTAPNSLLSMMLFFIALGTSRLPLFSRRR